MPPSSKRVLIIGAGGFVGSHVARAFVERGWEVTAFGPPQPRDLLADVRGSLREIEGSVEDPDSLGEAFAAARPDLALSFAAFSEGPVGLLRSGEAAADRAFAVNVSGFRRFLQAAQDAGVRQVLWSSSTVVYGPPGLYGDRRVDEAAPCRPLSFYGLTKLMAEHVARLYRDRFGLAVTGLRLPLVIGPGLWYRGAAAEIVRLFAEAAPGVRCRIAAPRGPIDLAYVKDVAAAFLAAAGAAHLEDIYNLGGFTASYAELAAAVQARVPGYEVEIEAHDPPFVFPMMDASRFKRDAGFVPRFDLEATVDDVLHALKGPAP